MQVRAPLCSKTFYTHFLDQVNYITLDDNKSTGLIKGVQFGVLQPGVSVIKTLHLLNTGSAGDRTIDVSIQSRSTASAFSPTTPVYPTSPSVGTTPQDSNETLQTLVIPTVRAIEMDHSVTYKRSLAPQMGVSDLRTFGGDYWDDAIGGEALITSTLRCNGPWSLKFESIRLDRKVGARSSITFHVC